MPPLNYVCFRCKKSGHYIQFCPTNNDPEYEMKSKTDAIPLAAEKVVVDFVCARVRYITIVLQYIVLYY
jgi:hypothetical protein